jgi:hypothetical protein
MRVAHVISAALYESMITFFNVPRKLTNDRMREELKRTAVPRLRDLGFVGKLPSFRRIKDGAHFEALEIQFNKYGGSFAVNLKIIEPSDDFLKISFDDLKVLRSQRLGSRRKRIKRKFNMDHWFKFLRGIIVYRQAYVEAEQSFMSVLDAEMDLIYNDLRLSIERGVFCIHLDRKNASV